MFDSVRKGSYTFGYVGIQMDVRISRISPIRADFFCFFAWVLSRNSKKNPYESVKSVKSVHPFVSQCIQKCNLSKSILINSLIKFGKLEKFPELYGRDLIKILLLKMKHRNKS
ncbi:MAG: hypothetical protein RLZZ628_3004 [Bacteroidota bacterium]|jgi:hypothetical protein